MRSSATLLILISFFFTKFACAQSNELLIQGQTGKLYLEHTVVAKENWYSVGRLYNVSPKELAPYNNTALTKPLVIGQVLQIPLTATNFSQTGVKAAGETLIPVIHITQEKEWMYRISVNHNKVPIPNIEKWNHVTPDQIHPGLHLIVGYLKVKTALSALATNPPAPTVATTTPAPAPTPARSEPPISKPAEAVASTTTKPTATKTMPPATDSPVASHQASALPPPATTSVTAPTTTSEKTPAALAEKPQTTTPINTPHFNGGTFKTDFTDGGRSATGLAGVFKSTSGWQDGKYYALMNNASVGSIVKITDPASGKSVYAKILGQLPDMKESSGLTIRISNAAAAELNQTVDGRFNVQINY